MSLGGFAQGLATAIQSAEDRYQERKLRKEASAEAKLRQAAGFAFQEKMYDRRVQDANEKEIRDTKAYLDATFGTGQRGQAYSAAFLNMGKSGIEVLKKYEAEAKERNIPLTAMLELTVPGGTTIEDFNVDFDTVLPQLKQQMIGQEVDNLIELPKVGFTDLSKLPSPFEKETGTTSQMLVNINKRIFTTETNIGKGFATQQDLEQLKKTKKIIEDELAREEQEAIKLKKTSSTTTTVGQDEIKASFVNSARNNVQTDFKTLLKQFVVEGAEDQFELKFVGNEKKILRKMESFVKDKDAIKTSLKNYVPSKTGYQTPFFHNEHVKNIGETYVNFYNNSINTIYFKNADANKPVKDLGEIAGKTKDEIADMIKRLEIKPLESITYKVDGEKSLGLFNSMDFTGKSKFGFLEFKPIDKTLFVNKLRINN